MSSRESIQIILKANSGRVEMEKKLGKIEKVEVRELWANESGEFTPWLAAPENIKSLGEAIGLELEVERTEVAVGPYSADIVAKEGANDSYVVIENQLGKSDHDHLGKLLTYGSALGASTVIWIAGNFTEEHRKALDWLNDNTTEDVSFLGIELELFKIDNSLPAVRFNVVSRPTVELRTVKGTSREGLSEGRLLQLEFWTAFEEKLRATRTVPSTQTPKPRYWFNVSLGKSGVFLSNIANTWDKRIGLRIYMRGYIADQALGQLLKEKDAIEKEIGEQLKWNPHPEKSDKTILLDRPADLSIKEKWPEYLDWLVEKTIQFRNAFGPRLKKMDLSRVGTDERVDAEMD
jgi:hypothetical protein